MARRLTSAEIDAREYYKAALAWPKRQERTIEAIEKKLKRIPHTVTREGAYIVYSYGFGCMRVLAESPYAVAAVPALTANAEVR